jgi:hypothetical protein
VRATSTGALTIETADAASVLEVVVMVVARVEAGADIADRSLDVDEQPARPRPITEATVTATPSRR